MSTITLTLSDETAARLADVARQRGLAIEAYLEQVAADVAAREDAVDAASAYVLRKNAELYRRLAQ
jgi:predicted transcriptional regulator